MTQTRPSQSSWTERIENAIAENLRDYVRACSKAVPAMGAAYRNVAGGAAAFLGVGSPITGVKGVRPVIGEEDLTEIERFYAGFGISDPTIETAPWLQDTSSKMLQTRGYKRVATEDVVVRATGIASTDTAFRIETVPSDEWPQLMREAYELPNESPIRELAYVTPHMPRGQSIGIRLDGRWAACAQMHSYDGVLLFSCDGTVPSSRGKGLQSALIDYRLRALPTDMIAIAEVTPGGGSERNYLRCGFQIAYTRTHWRKPLASS